MTRTAIQISSFSTLLKYRLLFRYPLFLSDTTQDCYSNIRYLYLKKIRTAVQVSSVPTRPKTETAIDILYFYLAQIGTAVKISYVPTRLKTKTAIQISSISTLQK